MHSKKEIFPPVVDTDLNMALAHRTIIPVIMDFKEVLPLIVPIRINDERNFVFDENIFIGSALRVDPEKDYEEEIGDGHKVLITHLFPFPEFFFIFSTPKRQIPSDVFLPIRGEKLSTREYLSCVYACAQGYRIFEIPKFAMETLPQIALELKDFVKPVYPKFRETNSQVQIGGIWEGLSSYEYKDLLREAIDNPEMHIRG